jgi:hypothetical protein
MNELPRSWDDSWQEDGPRSFELERLCHSTIEKRPCQNTIPWLDGSSLARFEVAHFVRFPEGDLSQSPESRSAPWEKSRNLIYPNGVASTDDVPSDATLSV